MVTCNPLSTSSSGSIKSVPFSGDVGEMDFDRNFAVNFSKDLCGLTVVMDCNDSIDIPNITEPYILDP